MSPSFHNLPKQIQIVVVVVVVFFFFLERIHPADVWQRFGYVGNDLRMLLIKSLAAKRFAE